MKRSVLALCLAMLSAAAPALGAGRRRAIRMEPPSDSPCAAVRGIPNLFVSFDGGKTFSGSAETPTRQGVWGVAVMPDDPAHAVAAFGKGVYDSADGGCSWTLRYTETEELHHNLHVVATGKGVGYLWTEELGLRYDHGAVVKLKLPENIKALAVDPVNPLHVRAIGLLNAVVWDSADGGGSWARKGTTVSGYVDSAAFDPSNFDRVFIANPSVKATSNSGSSWSTVFNTTTRVCRIAFTAAAPNSIWFSLPVAGGRVPVYHSTNGGGRFDQVASGSITASAGVCLEFVAHPSDPNVAAIPFGPIYWIDAASGPTSTTCCDGRITGISYSSHDEKTMWVSAPLP